MEKTTVYTTEETTAQRAAVNGLAVVGFLALVFIGIVLAVYAARYVPAVVTRIASFTGNSGGSGLSVVPTTTLSFPSATTTPATSTPSFLVPMATTTRAASIPSAQPVVGYHTVITTYPTPGSVQVPAGSQNLTGLPNLTTTVTAVGYLDNNNNFVVSNTINHSYRLAVEFRVTNTGTNASGVWNLSVVFPTRDNGSYEYDSDPQHSLNPGAYNDYVVNLSANDARVGDDGITISADPDNKIVESNKQDNDVTANVTVE